MLQLFVFPLMYCQTIKFGTGHYYDLQGVKNINIYSKEYKHSLLTSCAQFESSTIP